MKAFTVTQIMKDRFAELRAQGFTFRQIGKEMNVSSTCVQYHLKEPYRDRMKAATKAYAEKARYSPTERKKRRDYMRGYMKRRYHEEPGFRERMREANRKSARKKREKALCSECQTGFTVG